MLETDSRTLVWLELSRLCCGNVGELSFTSELALAILRVYGDFVSFLAMYAQE